MKKSTVEIIGFVCMIFIIVITTGYFLYSKTNNFKIGDCAKSIDSTYKIYDKSSTFYLVYDVDSWEELLLEREAVDDYMKKAECPDTIHILIKMLIRQSYLLEACLYDEKDKQKCTHDFYLMRDNFLLLMKKNVKTNRK